MARDLAADCFDGLTRFLIRVEDSEQIKYFCTWKMRTTLGVCGGLWDNLKR